MSSAGILKFIYNETIVSYDHKKNEILVNLIEKKILEINYLTDLTTSSSPETIWNYGYMIFLCKINKKNNYFFKGEWHEFYYFNIIVKPT